MSETSLLEQEIERLATLAARREIEQLREELSVMRSQSVKDAAEIIPSIKDLAERLGVSDSTIQSNLALIPHHRLPDSKRVFFVLSEVLTATFILPKESKLASSLLDYKQKRP